MDAARAVTIGSARNFNKNTFMKTKMFYVVILVCLIFTGCGGHGFVPASGKVTFDDGTLVTGGGIAFVTETFMADGKINSDGTFTLSSLKPGDGLPPGTYKVTIGWTETTGAVGPNMKTTNFIDPLFANVKTTTLTAEVTKGGKNRFDFVVTKPK